MTERDSRPSGARRATFSFPENYEALRAMFEHSSLGLAVLCPTAPESDEQDDWHYALANQAFERIAAPGGPAEGGPLEGQSLRAVHPPALARWGATVLSRIRRTGRSAATREYELRAGPGGEPSWWHVSAQPLVDERNQVAAVLVMMQEASAAGPARRGAEERDQAMAAPSAWRAAREAALFPAENPDPVLRVGADGALLYANEASAPLLAAWGCAAGCPVPEDWQARVAEALRSGARCTVECAAGERVFALRVAPIPAQNYVNIYGSDETERRRAEQKLRELNQTLERRVGERTAQLRALAARLAESEAQERHRLAQALHDELQQALAAAMLQLNLAERQPEDESKAHVREALRLLGDAVASSRALTADLSPAILHDDGLVPALHWLARRAGERYQLEVSVEAAEEPVRQRIAPDLAMILFQGARELLLNVHQHAGVRRARVELAPAPPDRLRLTVADEGRGFDPARPGKRGFGLFSVRERILHAGGDCLIESAPGRGTRVTLSLPLAENDADAEGPPQGEDSRTGGACGARGCGVD